jgi:hypothetical protein
LISGDRSWILQGLDIFVIDTGIHAVGNCVVPVKLMIRIFTHSEMLAYHTEIRVEALGIGYILSGRIAIHQFKLKGLSARVNLCA